MIRSIKKNELSNKEINILENSINKNNTKSLIIAASLGSRLKKHTKNLAPNYFVYLICKTIVIFFRAIPEFIIAMILVIAIGFGAMPGVLALGSHTMGFLAKFYAEDIEHINKGPIDALKFSSATKSQIILFGVIPQILPSFVANNLYILDRNVRMATMLGIVGAGGIGYELQSSFRMFEYERVSAIIILIFVTIFLIDHFSAFIRSKIK